MDSDTHMQAHWWGLTIRGIFAILFGIAAVFWPQMTLVTLVYLFSAWILVDGVVRIIVGLGGIGKRHMWLLTLLVGLLQVGVGVYLIRHPYVSFATLILLISFTLIIGGVIGVVSSLSDTTSTGKTLGVVSGVVAALAGILLLFQPASAGVAFVWIIGLFALIDGPLLIALSLDVKRVEEAAAAAPARRR